MGRFEARNEQGLGSGLHRVVMQRLGTPASSPSLDAQRMRIVVDPLSPIHPVKAKVARPAVPVEVLLFSEDEVKEDTRLK